MTNEHKEELRGLCEKAKLPQSNAYTRNMLLHAARTALPELLDDNDAKDREIERLAAQLAAANEENERLAALNDGLNNLPGLYLESQAQLAAVTSERDAAVKAMWLTRACSNCKHKPEEFNGIHFAGCSFCDDEDKWEWRGVQPKGETE